MRTNPFDAARRHPQRRFRLRVAIVLAALSSAAIATPGRAQSVVQAVGHDFRAAGTDIWHLWTSPFHAEARDWRDAGAVLATTAIVATADRRVDRWIAANQSSVAIRAVKPFREAKGVRLIDLGSGNLLLPVSGGLYVAGLATGSRSLRDAGIGCATAQQSNSILRGLIYSLVDRERPGTAEGRAYRIRFPGGEWNQHSFFGGHVANAFACSSYASTRFELGVIEPLLYTGAAGIGLARMADRRHWASDTFLGAAFGYAMGRSVALRQKHRLAREQESRRSSRIAPSLQFALGGFYSGRATDGSFALGWHGRF